MKASPVPEWQLRIAVEHFVDLAYSYENRGARPPDPTATALIEDVANMLLEHKLGPFLAMSQRMAAHQDLLELGTIYRNYSRGEFDQEALLDLVRQYFRTRHVTLSAGQERLLTPTRGDLSNRHNGPTTFSKEMIGLILYKVNGKTIHNWLRGKHRIPLYPAYGIPVSPGTRREYFAKVVPVSNAPCPETPPTREQSALKSIKLLGELGQAVRRTRGRSL